MTAAPLFAPALPPRTSPARPTQGEGPSDLAGLFAVLLAGTQPLEPDGAQGADRTARAAPALAQGLSGDLARTLAPSTHEAKPQALLTFGPVDAEAREMLPAAPALPPALPVRAQAGSGQDGGLPQLTAARAPAALPAPASAQSAERTRTGPALLTLADPSPGLRQAAADTPAPLPPKPAIAARPVVSPLGTFQAAGAPASPPELVAITLPADAKVPLAPGGESPQTSAPRAGSDALLTGPRMPPSASTGDRSIGAPGHPVARSKAPIPAPTPGAAGPDADPAAADEQGWLEPTIEASEGAVTRSEPAATEPARASTPNRAAPPAPMFQVGVQVAKAAPARIDRLFVQLEPASLGRVEVRLEFHRDNQVSAVIAAERPETLDALQRDARVLERSLQQAGLRLDSDGLTFSLKREQAHDHPREERRFAPPGDFADQPLPAAHAHEPPPLHWFRGLRALDIKV